MTTLAHRRRWADRRTAASPPAARSSAGPGACSAASGASRSWWCALLTVAVAAAIGSITVAYNSAPAEDAEFGSAGQLLRFDGGDPRLLAAGSRRRRGAARDDRRHRPPLTDRPRRRRQGRVPRRGPRGAYGGARLALRRGIPERRRRSGRHRRRGRAPGARDREDACPRRPSPDGRRHRREPTQSERRVRPRLPSSAGRPDRVTVLVDADADSLDAFIDEQEAGPRWLGPASAQQPGGGRAGDVLRGHGLLAAGHARRRRRLRRHRAATAPPAGHARRDRRDREAPPARALTNGAVVGAIGALLGTVAGLALWVALVPTLEPAFGHRIDPLGLPWALLAMVVLVAVLGATAAAWWPGRAVARVPSRSLGATPQAEARTPSRRSSPPS